jgi:hypothetical protein
MWLRQRVRVRVYINAGQQRDDHESIFPPKPTSFRVTAHLKPFQRDF